METTIIVTCCDLQAVAKLESGPQSRISHLDGLGVLRILFSDDNQGSSEQQLVLLLLWFSRYFCPQKTAKPTVRTRKTWQIGPEKSKRSEKAEQLNCKTNVVKEISRIAHCAMLGELVEAQSVSGAARQCRFGHGPS